MKSDPLATRAQFLILIAGPLITLAVSPSSNLDPINLIKLLALSTISFYLLFLYLTNIRILRQHLSSLLIVGVCCFIFWMIVVLLVVDAPKNQQFWGQFGRNSGFLTYLCLVLILAFTAMQNQRDFFHRIVISLIATNLPVVIYALIQLSGNDPIQWSLTGPFSTLGNVNFSSAFLGMASVAAFAIVLSPKLRIEIRIFFVLLILLNLLVIWESGSSQGLLIFLAGLVVTGFFFVRQFARKLLTIGYAMVSASLLGMTLAGFSNMGPAAKLVYSETLLYRFDYWFAGWAMTLSNPFFGVGLDSYGDWYREYRGEIATLRTIPDRITNTAHNIYLDISSSGGFPLLLCYLLILGLALRAAITMLMREKTFQPFMVAVFSVWIAYLIQAAISINQIAVGIWGWILTGALIGFERATRASIPIPGTPPSRKGVAQQLPISATLLGAIGVALGFTLAFIPFNADSKFRSSLTAGELRPVVDRSQSLGATAYHMELALDTALKANDAVVAAEATDALLARYPRDFMGWRVKQALSLSTPEERAAAFTKMREMDPFNPEIKPLE